MVDPSTTKTSSYSPVDLHLHTVIRDKYAREDLEVISWPDKNPKPDLADLKSYSYRETGRESSYIYIIENGVDSTALVRYSSREIYIILHAYPLHR